MAFSKEIRVIQLIDSLEPGGAERMAVTIANRLAEEVAFSGLVVTRLEGGLKNTINKKVGYAFVNKMKAIDFSALFRLRTFIKTNKVNTVHAHGSSYFFAVLLKLTMPSVQIFWHDHFGNRVKSQEGYFLLRFFSVFFSCVFTVNEALKDWAQKKLWVKNVEFLSNFTSDSEVEIPVTILNGTPNKRIVFLANLHHPKNHILALKSFLASKIANEGWTLHLIGKDKLDDYSEDLKDFIKQNNLKEAVFIYGSCNDVKSILNQAKVGILVSSYEGFPVTLLEYGMAGLTVISSNVGYCSTIIQNEVTGYLIASDNEAQLQSALIKIANESHKNDGLAKNLNTFVKANYAPEKVIQKIIDAYQKNL
ncbi:glycosyltransferase [Flavobacterium lacisediminis]|uniref:Glycosyltransferase n=1 Tax=Flavobacterium lacisediminis TaxID=2989705 RepID=A0ABT3EGX5_9FLAO|nr:glycosyltransferase [Flavobacterium lacisediminis]MCW1147828.1 glycosyltransferase [Flavobacterium lacisediminis]